MLAGEPHGISAGELHIDGWAADEMVGTSKVTVPRNFRISDLLSQPTSVCHFLHLCRMKDVAGTLVGKLHMGCWNGDRMIGTAKVIGTKKRPRERKRIVGGERGRYGDNERDKKNEMMTKKEIFWFLEEEGGGGR